MPSYAQESEMQIESAQNNDGCMGVRIGVNSNKYSGVSGCKFLGSDVSFDFIRQTGGHVSVFYTMEGSNFRLQPGLTFIQRKSEVLISSEEKSANLIYSLNYLQLPVEFSFIVIDFKGNGGLRFNMEPHLGLFVGGTLNNSFKITDNKILKDGGISSFDFGVSLGASLDFGAIEPYIAFDYGFTNVGLYDVVTSNNPYIANSSINMGLAFHF